MNKDPLFNKITQYIEKVMEEHRKEVEEATVQELTIGEMIGRPVKIEN